MHFILDSQSDILFRLMLVYLWAASEPPKQDLVASTQQLCCDQAIIGGQKTRRTRAVFHLDHAVVRGTCFGRHIPSVRISLGGLKTSARKTGEAIPLRGAPGI